VLCLGGGRWVGVVADPDRNSLTDDDQSKDTEEQDKRCCFAESCEESEGFLSSLSPFFFRISPRQWHFTDHCLLFQHSHKHTKLNTTKYTVSYCCPCSAAAVIKTPRHDHYIDNRSRIWRVWGCFDCAAASASLAVTEEQCRRRREPRESQFASVFCATARVFWTDVFPAAKNQGRRRRLLPNINTFTALLKVLNKNCFLWTLFSWRKSEHMMRLQYEEGCP